MLQLCHHTKYKVLTDDSIRYFVVIINVLSMLVAAIGNIITITVIVRTRKLREEPTYLFIGSVCLADALVAIVSQPLYIITLLLDSSDRYCDLYIAFFVVAWISAFGSVLGLNVVTFDRFLYIFHPMKYPEYLTKKRAILLVMLTWTIALVFALVPVVWLNSIALHSSLFCHNAVSCALAAATYYRIYRMVCSNSSKHPVKALVRCEGNKEEETSQRQATRTVFIVMIFFVGCWGPWTVLSFVMSIKEQFVTDIRTIYLQKTFKIMESLSLTLGFMSSSCNVFIYTFKNTTLREEWLKMIWRPLRDRKLRSDLEMEEINVK